MRRVLTCTLAFVMLLALSVPALADIIWEPMGNQFYDDHRGQCEYVGRGYYANGKEGFVTAWDAPGSSFVVYQYENGKTLWVHYLYKDWALIARLVGGQEISGWIPLSDLELKYDHISFEEEYADRITDYNGEFADYDGDVKSVNFYEYPGAAGINQSWDASVLDNLTGTADNSSYISKIFVDENGLTWGFVSYMRGHLDSWFCLDQPNGRDFPVRDVSAPQLTPAQTPVPPTRSYVPYILATAVVGATGGILTFFYRKKRKSAL